MLDLGIITAKAASSQVFAYFGADIIKVEVLTLKLPGFVRREMFLGFFGVGLVDFLGNDTVEGNSFVPRRYPEEFRRKVLDLVAAGRAVEQVAADLGISDQTIYVWRKQELIDIGQLPGACRAEQAELSTARRRIRELEQELAILKRARADRGWFRRWRRDVCGGPERLQVGANLAGSASVAS
ncbi:transposase [Nocardia fluminea]|uniref:transposase n=1 Tax=Nocardia fluminea TaxID=134984 RepID=UPI00344AFEC3